MNLFNCFQAMAFYTLSPFLAQYLFNTDRDVFAWITVAGIAVGYVLLSISLEDRVK